ncbi:methyl-accepting chemotaxis protein [Paraburkholderia sediminicola]|uniref:methyl-accepting chemotaxis protein n=1 Tax=Paraburkholderia sediminicola TaxID=458836 RepID=UPI0038B746DB
MTISKRLILTLTIALFALVFVGAMALWQLNQAQQRFAYVQENIIPSIAELISARADINKLRLLEYRHLLTTDGASKQSVERDMATLDASFERHIATYERDDISDNNDRRFLGADKVAVAAYRSARQRFLEHSRAGDATEAKDALLDGGAVDRTGEILIGVLMRHVEHNNELSQRLRDENNLAYIHALWLLVGGIVTAVLVCGGSGFQLYRSVTSWLNRMRHNMQHVGQSLDLTRIAKIERMDEIGQAATAFNVLLARISEVVGDVRRSASSVSVAAQQIAQGNLDLSSRTEEQAASLEETASSMQELTATVHHNADNAQQAARLAGEASENAHRGGEVVGRVVETMHQISDRSTRVAEIIGVIEGIAFQTNILALNAAVEAARAGEQGRGFAVVAGEVRALAQRSATAAKEIKDLIGESMNRVRVGSTLVHEARSTINAIVESVERMTRIMVEISSASEEQSTGIQQVNQAVSQMDQVTQQNAALVEEASAAAQSMAQQAQALHETVAIFKIIDAAPRMLSPIASEKNYPSSKLKVQIAHRTASTGLNLPPVTTLNGKQTIEAVTEIADWQAF